MKIINIVVLSVFGLSGCALDASNGSEGSPGGPGTVNPHCVIRLPSNDANDMSCFSTFRDAMAFATGGVIVDAPEADVARTDENFARRIDALGVTPNLTTVIGQDFTDIRWQGATFTWTTSLSGCFNGTTFSVASLVPFGWNDVISSFKSFANCTTVLHENINFTGATLTGVNVSFGGSAMEDAASSIEWF